MKKSMFRTVIVEPDRKVIYVFQITSTDLVSRELFLNEIIDRFFELTDDHKFIHNRMIQIAADLDTYIKILTMKGN